MTRIAVFELNLICDPPFIYGLPGNQPQDQSTPAGGSVQISVRPSRDRAFLLSVVLGPSGSTFFSDRGGDISRFRHGGSGLHLAILGSGVKCLRFDRQPDSHRVRFAEPVAGFHSLKSTSEEGSSSGQTGRLDSEGRFLNTVVCTGGSMGQEGSIPLEWAYLRGLPRTPSVRPRRRRW